MEDMGKRTQDWKDINPFIVWRKAQDLDSRQAAEKLGLTERRLLELEVGYPPTDEEWKLVTARTEITRDQWKTWVVAKPHIRVEAPKQ